MVHTFTIKGRSCDATDRRRRLPRQGFFTTGWSGSQCKSRISEGSLIFMRSWFEIHEGGCDFLYSMISEYVSQYSP